MPSPLLDHHDDLALAAAPAEATCYFSLVCQPSASAHYSDETPSLSPFAEYSPLTAADPLNPLLASRPVSPLLLMSNLADASRVLQLQTAAALRPAPQPHQPRASSTSSTSSSASAASAMLAPSIYCCRCRRESLVGMCQLGTNRYYCSHCARMTGYSAG